VPGVIDQPAAVDAAQPYKPVEGAVAQLVAQTHDKDIAVIITYDHAFKMLGGASYGSSPEAMDVAARWCDAFRVIAGGGEQFAAYEDYRATDAAMAQARIEGLVGQLADKDAQILELMERLEMRKKLVLM
jgi:hypothetical protein